LPTFNATDEGYEPSFSLIGRTPGDNERKVVMDARALPDRPNLEHYRKQAKDLVKRHRLDDPEAIRRIREHHPRFRKAADADIHRAPFALADAQLTIAREHAFESWPKFAKHIEAIARASSPASRFESAVDAIVTGDLARLESLLREHPELVRARSDREHRATLLHYVAANGVEDFRQKTPANAVTIAETLLRAGADADALADMYGQQSTTMGVLVSSIHPALAGVQSALVEKLLDFGAAVDGVADDSAPLMTALAFGYAAAAQTLVDRGARVDNIVAAAALGDLDRLRTFVNDDGSLKPGVRLAAVPGMRGLRQDPKTQMEQALVWSGMLDRAAVAGFLLQRGVDPSAQGSQGLTALHWAAFHGHMETLRLLLTWSPPLEVKNVYGGTVLDQTVWASAHRRNGLDYVPIIEMLLAAGANVGAVTEPSGNARVDDVLRRYGAKFS